jgi:hypothetical protein
MNKVIKTMVLLLGVMIILLFLPEIKSIFLSNTSDKSTIKELTMDVIKEEKNVISPTIEVDHWINDSVYVWNKKQMDWIASDVYENNQIQTGTIGYSTHDNLLKKPIKVNWKTLMNIKYRLKYFQQIQAEMFSPIFGEGVNFLNGKEVIIEGFVIPFDEEGELIALSYNPYSSCFFCGNASPASVISMYMKDEDVIYNLDDFRKFKGTLFLNQDDPNQFYYILKDAEVF